MKKVIAFILAALMLASLAACSSNSGKDNKKPDSNQSQTDVKKPDNKNDGKLTEAAPSEIEAAVAKALGKGYLCDTDIDKDTLANTIRLDLTKIDSYTAKQNSISSVNLDCAIVLKVKDGYADEAVKCLNEYYASFVDYIRQYPFGVAKVEGAKLYKNGNTIAFILAGDPGADDMKAEAEAKLAADEYKKVDEAVKSYFELKNLAVTPKEDNGGNGGGFIEPDDMEGGVLIGG